MSLQGKRPTVSSSQPAIPSVPAFSSAASPQTRSPRNNSVSLTAFNAEGGYFKRNTDADLVKLATAFLMHSMNGKLQAEDHSPDNETLNATDIQQAIANLRATEAQILSENSELATALHRAADKLSAAFIELTDDPFSINNGPEGICVDLESLGL